MEKYGKAIKAYVFLRSLLAIILSIGAITLVLVIVINLVPNVLSEYRTWLEENILAIIVLLSLILLAVWHRLMPTLRTIFKIRRDTSGSIDRLNDNSRLIVVFGIGVALLMFASISDASPLYPLMQHPARYGYVGNLLIAIALLGLVAKLFSPPKAEVIQGIFVSDDPGDYPELTASQRQAAKYLFNVLNSGLPRSVALTGDWGSGKTAVYRKTRLDIAKSRDDIIWVDFDPWRYASEESLVKGFYESVARKIDDEIPGYQNALRSMANGIDQLISKSDKSGIFHAISSTVREFAVDESNPDKIIKELLSREGKRLIVVVDNVERQYDTERTYRALQLVHHLKAMGKDNVQMLCIFEKATLLRAAPLHVPSAEEYLEKFSEIEISIPPPDESSLRTQLEKLLSEPRYAEQLPDDFELKLSPESVRDIKSHRGIIRAFNELILELNSSKGRQYKLEAEDEDGTGAITYVNYTDRFLMGHLKLKYPLIFRDIAQHRGEYTQVKEDEADIRSMLMDDKELTAWKKARLDDLLEEANLNKEQKDTLQDLLSDLFPEIKNVINRSKSYVDVPKLRSERRVGHRDVLDAYFALTASQDAYERHVGWIDELLQDISAASDANLISRFSAYMDAARNDSSAVDSITLLRNELMKPKHAAYQLRAFRAWLRVMLGSELIEVDENNRGLGSVLSAINEVVLKRQPEERTAIVRDIFNRVTKYIKNPTSALLMLLFLLPEQGNNYLSDYINSKAFKPKGLYQRVLEWVDNYYAENQVNIYAQYQYRDWAFIAYQWAFSIRSSGVGVNSKVIEADARYERVNQYLFSMLNQDDGVACQFVFSRFWIERADEGYDDEDGGWRVNSETTAPYDLTQLLSLAEKLVNSKKITAVEKKSLKNFVNDLKDFIK